MGTVELTPSRRRWLALLAAVFGLTGALGLSGGLQERKYQAPPGYAVGDSIETTRFTYRITGAQWSTTSEGEARLVIHLRVLNTTKDSEVVGPWRVATKLPDGGVLPADDDPLAWVTKDGPGRFLPGIDAPATLTFTKGLPDEKPDEVRVFVADEMLAEEQGVYAEFWQPGDLAGEVRVTVEETE